jgi:hypothetical protein
MPRLKLRDLAEDACKSRPGVGEGPTPEEQTPSDGQDPLTQMDKTRSRPPTSSRRVQGIYDLGSLFRPAFQEEHRLAPELLQARLLLRSQYGT